MSSAGGRTHHFSHPCQAFHTFSILNINPAPQARTTAEGDDEDEGEAAAPSTANYDYLLSMPLSSLTWEKVQQLQADAAGQAALVARLHATTGADMWVADLDAFLEVRAACDVICDLSSLTAITLLDYYVTCCPANRACYQLCHSCCRPCPNCPQFFGPLLLLIP